MEIQKDVITTAPLDSATLLILRDSKTEPGVEVFMIRRHVKSSVLGGVYVFPGGKVDPKDASDDFLSRLDLGDHILKQRLSETELSGTQAAAIFIAAIRETFEECGVLFAHSKQDSTRVPQEFDPSQDLLSILDQQGMCLSTKDLIPFSRWITPQMSSVMNKRFDTRFFLAKHPDLQVAKHDNHEASDSAWMSPRTALEKYWEKEIEMAPPQIMSLVNLSNYQSADEALIAAKAKAPALIQPEPFDENGVRHIAYPGHPKHSESGVVMSGPKMLRYVNDRFEPLGGFEAFFENK